ncbi:MAG: STAS domain-containing protein [Gemmataceae bacterium]|nr:STAS domain-containing protein [Gemmataceae bacterium]
MAADQNAFRFHKQEDGSRVTVSFPSGTALNESNAESFFRDLSGLAAGRENPHLVLDLTDINVLTSVILTKLLSLHKQYKGAGGQLSIRNATPTVQMVFKVTKLDTVLDVQKAG